MATRKEDKLIKEIIKRYGETLDLKSSPYLIVEIIRNFSPLLDDGVVARGVPAAGRSAEGVRPQRGDARDQDALRRDRAAVGGAAGTPGAPGQVGEVAAELTRRGWRRQCADARLALSYRGPAIR